MTSGGVERGALEQWRGLRVVFALVLLASPARALVPRVLALGLLLGIAACHAAPAPQPQRVARHFLVLVTEGPDDDRHDSIVIAEPLERVQERRSAFAYRNAGYIVDARWREATKEDAGASGASGATGMASAKAHEPCLEIGVARADFNVRGCVATDAPTAPLGHVALPDGTSIDVAVWFFNQS